MPELPDPAPAPAPLDASARGLVVHGAELAWTQVRHVAFVDEGDAPVRAPRPAPFGAFRPRRPAAAPVRVELVVADLRAVRDRFTGVPGTLARAPRGARGGAGVLVIDLDPALGGKATRALLRRLFAEAEANAVPEGWYASAEDATAAQLPHLSGKPGATG
ncbi:hypothetical protein ACDF64_01390 [Agromyces sp. MMS24-JH15]|uniref:hypothetical protein n=1 Tax=Agromyces sp. MMS24-JH15 TaxID=3243765 RepID=UPI0037492B93